MQSRNDPFFSFVRWSSVATMKSRNEDCKRSSPSRRNSILHASHTTLYQSLLIQLNPRFDFGHVERPILGSLEKIVVFSLPLRLLIKLEDTRTPLKDLLYFTQICDSISNLMKRTLSMNITALLQIGRTGHTALSFHGRKRTLPAALDNSDIFHSNP
jgi:hypothetical protein